MRELETQAFGNGVCPDALMEKAGRGIASVIQQFFPTPGHCTLFCGKGNNAGDILVAGRHLAAARWQITLDLAFAPDQLSPLAKDKLQQLRIDAMAKAVTSEAEDRKPKVGNCQSPSLNLPSESIRDPQSAIRICLDGLLGIGASGEPRSPISDAIRRMQALRNDGAYIIAADIPSGLDANTGKPSECCVQADITATIAIPKIGLLADTATNYVGRLAVVHLKELLPRVLTDTEVSAAMRASPPGSAGVSPAVGVVSTPILKSIAQQQNNVDVETTSTTGETPVLPFHSQIPAEVAIPETLRGWLPPREFDSHKGNYGRLGIVAGSPGFIGAAHLVSLGALHGGAGLITLYVPQDIYSIVATRMPPEIMVKPITSYLDVLNTPHDSIALGPGLGTSRCEEICELINKIPCPAVIDADALNCLAAAGFTSSSQLLNPDLVLTPHPGEMARLYPEHPIDRRATAETFASTHNVTVLLKGARTVVATPKQPTFFNPTGTPGMSTGGMGDILTGLIGALLAQHISPHHAAVLGAWLAGHAAEIAITRNQSEQSLSAYHIAKNLGRSFQDLRKGCY